MPAFRVRESLKRADMMSSFMKKNLILEACGRLHGVIPGLRRKIQKTHIISLNSKCQSPILNGLLALKFKTIWKIIRTNSILLKI